LRTRRCARALTFLARFETRDAQLCGHPVRSVFECDFEIVTKIGAALRRGASLTTAPTAKHIAEPKQVAKNVFDSAKTWCTPRARTGTARNARMTEPVITLPLFRVRQNAVSLGCFFKLLFRRGIVGILVWVVLDCQTAISRLQLLIAGGTAHAEYFVIVTLAHPIPSFSIFHWSFSIFHFSNPQSYEAQ
jgi:hypothetical protein